MNRGKKNLVALSAVALAVAIWLWLRDKNWTGGGLFGGSGQTTGSGGNAGNSSWSGIYCPVCGGYYDTIHVHL